MCFALAVVSLSSFVGGGRAADATALEAEVRKR